MAPQKSVSKGVNSASYICDNCKLTFVGKECPECGNTKGNHKVGADGIELAMKSPKAFLSPELSADLEDPFSDDYLMSLQAARMANETFKENLRDAYVMKSELSRLDVEAKLLNKKKQLDLLRDGVVETYPPSQHTLDPQQTPQTPLFGSQSPQAQFMSQLMRMNGENRAEFIQQLSDADPSALNTLSSMFSQPMQNPGGFPGAAGMYPPPWMMQQQPHPEPKESTTEVMRSMFELMKEMQPERDNSAKEIVNELKDELRTIHSRIDSVVEKKSNDNSAIEPLVQYIKQVEDKIDSMQHRPSFKDQVNEIAEITKDLKTLGLINSGSPGAPLEDQIKLRELDHQIEMENKKFNLEQERAEIEKTNQNTRERLVQQLFSKGLSGTRAEDVPEIRSPAPQRDPTPSYPPVSHSPVTISKPKKIIVDEYESDAGTVREVKASSEYTDEGEY